MKYKVGDEVAYIWYGKLSTGIVEEVFSAYDGHFCKVSGEQTPINIQYLIPSPIAKIKERIAYLNEKQNKYEDDNSIEGITKYNLYESLIYENEDFINLLEGKE